MARKRRTRIAGRIAWKEAYKTKQGTRYIVRYRDEQGAKINYGGGLTEDEALSVIDQIEEARERTAPKRVAGQARDLADLLEDYLGTALAEQRMGIGNADNIRRAVQIYCQTVKDPELANSSITREKAPKLFTCADITLEAVDAWRAGPHGKDWIQGAIKSFMRWCAAKRKQAVDPVWLMREPPRVRAKLDSANPDDDLLEDEVVARIYRQMAANGPSMELLAHLLTAYGKRPITCLHILHQDWDLEGRRLFIRHVKRQKPYWHQIHDRTVELARAVIDPARAQLPPPPTKEAKAGDRCLLDPRTGKPWATPRDTADKLAAWYRWQIGHVLKLGRPQIIRSRYKRNAEGERMTDDKGQLIEETVVQHNGGPRAGIYLLKDWGITKLVQQHEKDPDSITLDDIYKFSGTKSLDRYRKTNAKRQDRSLAQLPIIGADLEAI